MTPHEQVNQFNARVRWGDRVYAEISGRRIDTTTRALAQVLHDGRPVIWVDGHTGAVPLADIRANGKALPVPRKLRRRKTPRPPNRSSGPEAT